MKSTVVAAACLLLTATACKQDNPSAARADPGPGTSPAAISPASTSVTILAASSLYDLLTEFADEWKKKTGRDANLQFDASSTLARQIQAGAAADVFITAAPEWLDQLKVVDRYDWLSNRLVCVVRKEVANFDLETVDSLAMAGEQVPAGKYARAALAHLGIRPPARTIYGSNVRDVLSKVSQGGATAGIVYATDVAVDPGVRIAYTFPEESHPKILYSVGVLSENGREVAAALRDPAAIAVAVKLGFVELK